MLTWSAAGGRWWPVRWRFIVFHFSSFEVAAMQNHWLRHTGSNGIDGEIGPKFRSAIWPWHYFAIRQSCGWYLAYCCAA